MYKVIVADDEPLMLEGWKTMIDWEGHGYELCGTASDGEEALELFGVHHPDLVVTDIRMPVLNGLELIQTLKSRPDSYVRSVIVSGYTEFGYAQQALRSGADRYVLKPIVTEEIHAMLGELLMLLDQGRTQRKAAAALRDASEEALLVRLLRGESPAEGASLPGAAANTPFCVLLGEAAENPAFSGRVSARDSLRQLADDLRAAGTEAWTFDDGPGRAGLLAACMPEGIDCRLTRLRSAASGLSVYVSGGGRGCESLPLLYGQAINLRERAAPLREAAVYRYADTQTAGNVGFAACMASAEAILKRVEDGEPEAAAREVTELFRLFGRLLAPVGWTEGVVRYLYGELLHREQKKSPPDLPCSDLRADRIDRFAEAKLQRRCVEAAEAVRSKHPAGYTPAAPIAEAVEYVRTHYRDKLQLRDLADKAGLSPIYFGQQFKRETGYGFNEYMHRLRAEEAQRLLRRTDRKISEIAGELGYHDTEYFAAKFRAVTGELPSLYRSRERGRKR
ncbi:response regulator [Saccharibacillus qingshengii]|uniref:response regulator n=1 Tax=Saccharibacillus qingshengii TaxID=1763540 RepID=UPI001555B3D5|nr:response regulator [Saccharibacillus qingshengii]